MRYRRHIPETADREAVDAVIDHVRAHLSAVVDPDDDPETHAGSVIVQIRVLSQDRFMIDESAVIEVRGEIHDEPTARYLSPDFDPNVDYTDVVFRRPW